MKKMRFYLWAVALCSLGLAACSDDKDAEAAADWITVDFETVPADLLAGPGSYGENLYSTYDGSSPSRFTDYTLSWDGEPLLTFGVNEFYGSVDFWNGGVAVSNWNIRSDAAGQAEGWWYTYENQCSLYNTAVADGARTGGGHSGSNFAVVTGSQMNEYSECGKITLARAAERIFDHLYVCNAAYTYGVIANGNRFNGTGSLASQQGWFKLIVRGYKAGSSAAVAVDELFLADYSNGRSEVLTTWTRFELTNIRKQPVNRIEFDFAGSDMGEYGLNTPTYVCIDDLCISKK